MKQYVYLMQDKHLPKWVKIGEVHESTPEERAAHLGFNLIKKVEVKNSRKSESELHDRYDRFRVSKELTRDEGITEGFTEFFEMTVDEGKYALDTINEEHEYVPFSPFADRFLREMTEMTPTPVELSLLTKVDQRGRKESLDGTHVDNLADLLKDDSFEFDDPLIIRNDEVLHGNHRYNAYKKSDRKEAMCVKAEHYHLNEKDIQDISEAANKDNKHVKAIDDGDIRALLKKHADKLVAGKGMTMLEAYREMLAQSKEFANKWGRKSATGITRSINTTINNIEVGEKVAAGGVILVTKHNKESLVAELKQSAPERSHLMTTTKNDSGPIGQMIKEMLLTKVTSGTIWVAAEGDSLDKTNEERIKPIKSIIDFLKSKGLELDIDVKAFNQKRDI